MCEMADNASFVYFTERCFVVATWSSNIDYKVCDLSVN